MKRGFTLVELLVVIAMLMLLIGAVSSSVATAQKRAKIVQATAEAQEMTNAILAYENFGKGYSLASHTMEGAEANEGNLGFILGLESAASGGGKVPVLFNASIRNGAIRDPWGHPYLVTVKQGASFKTQSASSDNIASYVAFPNFNRRYADQ